MPHIGDRATRALTVTDAHVRQYADMTGDRNPLHFDAEFARRTRFKGLVVQGAVLEGEAWCCTVTTHE